MHPRFLTLLPDIDQWVSLICCSGWFEIASSFGCSGLQYRNFCIDPVKITRRGNNPNDIDICSDPCHPRNLYYLIVTVEDVLLMNHTTIEIVANESVLCRYGVSNITCYHIRQQFFVKVLELN
jgi:hypothetical protein